VNKAEIISKTLKALNLNPPEPQSPISEDQDEEAFIVSVLRDRLPDGVDIRTCADLWHLNVRCCETCHNFCPHYEMKLIMLPDGSPAWLCDTVEWAAARCSYMLVSVVTG
jgi:hypothetical protein